MNDGQRESSHVKLKPHISTCNIEKDLIRLKSQQKLSKKLG